MDSDAKKITIDQGVYECTWIVVQPVHSKGDQSWVFIGRTDVKAEAPIVWLPDAKNYSLEKTLMLGKVEGWKRSG